MSSGYHPEPLLRRFLAVADILAVAVAAALVGLWGSGPEAAFLLALFAPIWIVTAKLAGLYDRDHRTLRHLTVDELPWLMVWTLSSTALLTLLLAPFPALDLSSDDRLLVWGTVLGLGFAFRASVRTLWRRITPPQRMLIVGDGPLAEAVVRKLELFPDIHAEVTGRVESCALLHKRVDELVPTVDRVMIACRELNEEILEQLLPACRLNGVRLTIVPPTRGMFGTATNLTHIADLPLLDYNTWDISRMTLGLKRVFDVLLALVALVATLPLFLLASIATLVDSGRPIFFRQTRAGERGRPFQMLKFRTMVQGAEALLAELVPFDELESPMFKLKSDPRVTRVGRLLRGTSIDELPQLLNVLRGEMSVVGPRPEQLDLVERYSPEHRFRLQVKPGITGPMQVYGRGELSFEERLAVEREYVENISLARDLRIVLMTLPAVLRRRGRVLGPVWLPDSTDSRLLVAGVVAFLALVAYLAVAFANTHASNGGPAPVQANKLFPWVPHNSNLVAVGRRRKGRYAVEVTPAQPGNYGTLVPTVVASPAQGRFVVGLSLKGARPGRIGVEVDEFRPGATSIYVVETTVPATARWHQFTFRGRVKGDWLGLGMYVYRLTDRGVKSWFAVRDLTVSLRRG